MRNSKTLTFDDVTKINVERCKQWHKRGVEDWTPAQWMTATMGELGEAANALKKLFRIEDNLQNISDPERQISSRQQAIACIGEELADTFLYLNLFAHSLGIDLPTEIIAKFNKTSERYAFPHRL